MSNLPHVYKKIKPAIVAIGIPLKRDEKVELLIGGTGFCVHTRGIIVTCRHVFEGLQELVPGFRAELARAMERPNVVQAISQYVPMQAMFFFEKNGQWGMTAAGISDVIMKTDIDIAVLRTTTPALHPFNTPYPVARLGDSNDLREGQAIAASGFPFGYDLHKAAGSANSSLSVGVVSAILPAPPVVTIAPDAFKSFQLDMTVNRGNSGGPVFRPEDGVVLGIVSGGYALGEAPAGINFAIPVNWAKPVIQDMLEKMDAFRLQASRELTSGRDPDPVTEPGD